MRRAAAAWLGLGLCFLSVALPVLSFADMRTAENAQFEIVGLDKRSVFFVNDLSRYVVETAERYFEPERLQFPQRILISLKPAEYVNFEGDYEIRVAEPGLVSLDLLWEEETSLRLVFRAVAEALLVRYSIFNYGLDGLSFLPEWPASAIGTEAYLRIRPAQSENLALWVDPVAGATLEAVLKRRWDEPVADANGYALLLAMKKSGLTRAQLRAMFARAAAGMDVSTMLDALIQPQFPDATALTLEEWWEAGLSDVTLPGSGFLETMEVSRGWLHELSDMSTIADGKYTLRTIWAHREEAEVRATIEARYEILRLRLIRVNPAYFNAASSLGTLFEALLKGERKFEYIHSLTAFLGDFEDTRQMEAAVSEALK